MAPQTCSRLASRHAELTVDRQLPDGVEDTVTVGLTVLLGSLQVYPSHGRVAAALTDSMSDAWRDSLRVFWLRFTGSFELLDNARQNVLRKWLPGRRPASSNCCLNEQVCRLFTPPPPPGGQNPHFRPRLVSLSPSQSEREKTEHSAMDAIRPPMQRLLDAAGLCGDWSQRGRRPCDRPSIGGPRGSRHHGVPVPASGRRGCRGAILRYHDHAQHLDAFQTNRLQ